MDTDGRPGDSRRSSTVPYSLGLLGVAAIAIVARDLRPEWIGFLAGLACLVVAAVFWRLAGQERRLDEMREHGRHNGELLNVALALIRGGRDDADIVPINGRPK